MADAVVAVVEWYRSKGAAGVYGVLVFNIFRFRACRASELHRLSACA